MKRVRLILYLTVSVWVYYVNGKALTINSYDAPGYYWRDYAGKLPDDAVPGGTDDEGRTTYIGQTAHLTSLPVSLTLQPSISLLPGAISVNHQKMFYEFGGASHSQTEDVKILCSQHPKQLEWITTKRGDSITSLGKDKHFILGGHDRTNGLQSLAIGRKTLENGEVQIAQVLIQQNKFLTIHLHNSTKGWVNNGSYEVLIYNPYIFMEDQRNCMQIYNLHFY